LKQFYWPSIQWGSVPIYLCSYACFTSRTWSW